MFSIFAEGTTLTTPDFTGTVNTSKEALQTSFSDAWHRIVSFTPNLLAAIVVLVVGYFVAKFVARAVTITCPPFRRGRSWLTAATASLSSTLSRIMSQVGWVSSQRRTAAIFATSSRASFSGKSRLSGAVSTARLAFSAAASLARTNRSAE